jgi:hypothetical protein
MAGKHTDPGSAKTKVQRFMPHKMANKSQPKRQNQRSMRGRRGVRH